MSGYLIFVLFALPMLTEQTQKKIDFTIKDCREVYNLDKPYTDYSFTVQVKPYEIFNICYRIPIADKPLTVLPAYDNVNNTRHGLTYELESDSNNSRVFVLLNTSVDCLRSRSWRHIHGLPETYNTTFILRVVEQRMFVITDIVIYVITVLVWAVAVVLFYSKQQSKTKEQ